MIVEPDAADCLQRSAASGAPAVAPDDLRTCMAGLACGEPSAVAWPILERTIDAFLAIPDEAAERAMRFLAEPRRGDPAIVAGESGAASVAGLLAALRGGSADGGPHAAQRAVPALDGRARVLAVVTEGDTDPEAYARVVGRPAANVLERERRTHGSTEHR